MHNRMKRLLSKGQMVVRRKFHKVVVVRQGDLKNK